MKKKTMDIIRDVHEILKEKGITISVAESCTGGLISHYLTFLPGASTFFKTGIVAYSIESKKRILGISDEIIDSYGTISEQTAREMSEKIRHISETDYSIATTGNLGPDVMEGKEKGLIYIAISKKGQTIIRELRLKGERQDNKEEASITALRMLLEQIQ